MDCRRPLCCSRWRKAPTCAWSSTSVGSLEAPFSCRRHKIHRWPHQQSLRQVQALRDTFAHQPHVACRTGFGLQRQQQQWVRPWPRSCRNNASRLASTHPPSSRHQLQPCRSLFNHPAAAAAASSAASCGGQNPLPYCPNQQQQQQQQRWQQLYHMAAAPAAALPAARPSRWTGLITIICGTLAALAVFATALIIFVRPLLKVRIRAHWTPPPLRHAHMPMFGPFDSENCFLLSCGVT